jgi:hypothetical protein
MKLVGIAINIGAIATCLAVTLSLQLPRVRQKIVGETPQVSQQIVEQERTRLKFIKQFPRNGFGFNNLIADLTFLGFQQYFGDDKAREANKTGYSLSPEYFEVIVDRDPRFLLSYLFLSTSTSIYAAQPCKSIALYAKGAQSLVPEQQAEAYTVWRYKGIDELLFLGNGELARQSYLKAAEWVDRATFDADSITKDKSISRSFRDSAEVLKINPRSREARIAAWGSVLAAAIDKKTVQIAVQELAELGMNVKADNNGKLSMTVIPGYKPANKLNVKVAAKTCTVR